MFIAADINLVSLALKGLVLLGLFGCGAYLLAQARRARRPAMVVNGRVVSKGLQRMTPIVVASPPPRLKPGAELGRLADVIRTARQQVDTITDCQRTAARHLDSAEVALSRLMSEIVGVMPVLVAPVAEPHRRPMAMAA